MHEEYTLPMSIQTMIYRNKRKKALHFIINYDIKYRMGNELEAYIHGDF